MAAGRLSRLTWRRYHDSPHNEVALQYGLPAMSPAAAPAFRPARLREQFLKGDAWADVPRGHLPPIHAPKSCARTAASARSVYPKT